MKRRRPADPETQAVCDRVLGAKGFIALFSPASVPPRKGLSGKRVRGEDPEGAPNFQKLLARARYRGIWKKRKR